MGSFFIKISATIPAIPSRPSRMVGTFDCSVLVATMTNIHANRTIPQTITQSMVDISPYPGFFRILFRSLTTAPTANRITGMDIAARFFFATAIRNKASNTMLASMMPQPALVRISPSESSGHFSNSYCDVVTQILRAKAAAPTSANTHARYGSKAPGATRRRFLIIRELPPLLSMKPEMVVL